MWWAGSKRSELYLGTRRVVLYHGARLLLAREVDGIDAALVTAREALGELTSTSRPNLWLSGGLCRPFLVPGAAQMRSLDEVRAAARSLAGPRAGLAGDCEVWIDTARGRRGDIAVAVQRSVLDRLREDVGKGRRVGTIRPWWSEVLRHGLQKPNVPHAIGVQDCDSFTVLAGQGGAFSLAATFAPVTDPAAATSIWRRCLMTAEVADGRQWMGRLRVSPAANAKAAGVGAFLETVP